MLSIESARGKAYSEDMRWRMIYQKNMGLSYREIGKNLNVDPSTIYRTVRLFEETGTVLSIQGYHEDTTKKLSTQDELTIIEAILDRPSMYLHELQHAVNLSSGTTISTSTICKFLHRQRFSRTKLMFRAQQRSEELRSVFQSEISLLEPHMFVFVDETGTDKRLALRRYGYSLKGTRAVTDRQLIRGKRFSAIAAICLEGVIDVQITTHSVNGDQFCDFVERCLQPQLLPFNGTNPRSVVILDNATIHHVESAISLIEETGALAIYLPPYSPDLMPIEECFSKVKAYIRAYDPLVQILTEYEMEEIILSAFTSVTPEDCYGWMMDCGYI